MWIPCNYMKKLSGGMRELESYDVKHCKKMWEMQLKGIIWNQLWNFYGYLISLAWSYCHFVAFVPWSFFLSVNHSTENLAEVGAFAHTVSHNFCTTVCRTLMAFCSGILFNFQMNNLISKLFFATINYLRKSTILYLNNETKYIIFKGLLSYYNKFCLVFTIFLI